MTALSKVNPDHVVSNEKFHQELLGRAYREAELSSDWWRQVGAVIVREGKIICAAHNAHMPSEHTPYIVGDPRSSFDAGERIDLSSALHGEVGAIAIAAKRGIPLLGADIYVTTFPCTNCARAIAGAGFSRVFYAEGYSQIEGEEVLRSRGIEIVRVQLPEPSS
jgi:deoxycytidylate deaminase